MLIRCGIEGYTLKETDMNKRTRGRKPLPKEFLVDRMKKRVVGTIINGHEIIDIKSYGNYAKHGIRYVYKIKCDNCNGTRWFKLDSIKGGALRQCSCFAKHEIEIKRIKSRQVVEERRCKREKYGYFKYVDISGERFGKLIAGSFAKKGFDKNNNQYPLIKCTCDCGNEEEVNYKLIISGSRTRCSKCIAEDNRQKAISTNKKKNAKRQILIDKGIMFPPDKKRGEWARRFTKEIRYKYNNTCQKCNTQFNDYSTCAHHIKQYARNRKLRALTANGILLCRKCHDKFHKTYGFDDFDSFAIVEYLGWKDRMGKTS